jgi:serine/threonine protein phosphatase PrpC
MQVDAYSIKGKRGYMEDRSMVINNAFYQVAIIFDGHGGKDIAEAATNYMDKTFEFKPLVTMTVRERCQFLQQQVMKMDRSLSNIIPTSGSTMVMFVLYKKSKMCFVVNLGDSRLMGLVSDKIYMLNEQAQYIQLQRNNNMFVTQDHTPKMERKRIEDMGGFVEDDRVNGVLAIAKSLGDRDVAPTKPQRIKGKLISSVPDIFTFHFEQIKSPLILSSDGVYESLNLQDVFKLLRQGAGAKEIVRAAYEKGSSDNISAIKLG